jgi:DNA-binding MarR family transcriptional regulator
VRRASISPEPCPAVAGLFARRVDPGTTAPDRRRRVKRGGPVPPNRTRRAGVIPTVEQVGEIDSERRAAIDRAENAEFAGGVLERLLPVVGEFLRADAAKLGLDHSMLAVLDVLGIVSPLSVAALAGRCSLSHAAATRAVGRLVEHGYAGRITDEGDGRSSWWVGRAALADEALEAGRAALRDDLELVAAQLPTADRLAVLHALPVIVGVVARHAHIRRESRWRETQYRRWQERQRERW